MDNCAYFLSPENATLGVINGAIWGGFTIIWLCFTCFSTNHMHICMELFIGLITLLCSVTEVLSVQLHKQCIEGEELDIFPHLFVICVAKGMFGLLQVLIARGYGIVRYEANYLFHIFALF